METIVDFLVRVCMSFDGDDTLRGGTMEIEWN